MVPTNARQITDSAWAVWTLNGGESSSAYAWAASNGIGCLQWGWNNWGGASNLDSLITTNPWNADGAPAP
ncbi:MAG: hypothetical protein ACLQFF_01865 [Steroidobacteraceae bacterium]|jgi:hypothetical protein